MHLKVASSEFRLGPKRAPVIYFTNVTQYSTNGSGSWAQPTLPLHPHLKTTTNLSYITYWNHNITQNYYVWYGLLSMVESHTHMPPCKSLVGTVEHLTPQCWRRAEYYNNSNCVAFLAHPPVHLPVVSTLTLGEDNDHHDQRHHCKRKVFGGRGKCWMTVIPGWQTTAPKILLIG
jgi:hypothetical protein